MLAITCRRSSLVLATMKWMTPAPRSKPSSRTYTASMIATRRNQTNSMGYSSSLIGNNSGGLMIRYVRLRTMFNLPANKKEKQNGQQRIHSQKSQQREQRVSSGYTRRNARRR